MLDSLSAVLVTYLVTYLLILFYLLMYKTSANKITYIIKLQNKVGNMGKRSNFEYLRSFRLGIWISLELVIINSSIGI